jgi:hypothetical protein
MVNRRSFLRNVGTFAALGGVGALADGCCSCGLGSAGGSMQDFALPPKNRVRVGFVGIGGRGTSAVHRVSMIPGVDIVALCDKVPGRVKENLEWLRSSKYPITPRSYVGDEAYKELCDFGECDVIYCATPWALHQPVALRALCGGKIPLVEVTSALTVDECWELVEASEKYRLPCMQLENCCYGEMELLGLHLARLGMLGELVHGEGAYIHDLRRVCATNPKGHVGEWQWRYDENMQHKGNRYPTHGLLPIMQAMDINRGDRFDYLVSLESMQASCEIYRKFAMAPDDPRRKDPVMEMGDMNTTLIKTKKGRSIMVQHDVSSPRPYSRINLLSGTKGIWWGMPWRTYGSDPVVFKVGFEEKVGSGVHTFMKDADAEALRQKYAHPLWKQLGEVGRKVGGHGGMDFIMDLRWAYCLQNGLPLDMDVYDLAASSCLCELTEKSVRSRSKAMDVPDFTRGGWRTAKSQGVLECDMSKLNFGRAAKDEAALNV